MAHDVDGLVQNAKVMIVGTFCVKKTGLRRQMSVVENHFAEQILLWLILPMLDMHSQPQQKQDMSRKSALFSVINLYLWRMKKKKSNLLDIL